MADFAHLAQTMNQVKGGGKPEKKGKKKKDGTKKKKESARPASPAKKTKDGKKKASQKKTEGGSKASKSSKSSAAPKKPAAATGNAVEKRMGGIDWKAIEKQQKLDAKKAKQKMGSSGGNSDKSKIFQALNPEQLWKKTAAEKRAAEDDENIMVVEVRGAGGLGVLAAEDMQAERDEFGNLVYEEEEEESDFDENDLADFDDDTMGELAKNRAKRAAEEKQHRDELRRRSIKEKEEKQKKLDAELAKIAKKEAKLKKKTAITDDDVKATQARLDEEFESFGFGFE